MKRESLSVRVERGGPFSAEELAKIFSRGFQFDTLEIAGQYYNAGLFCLQARAAYAKSIVYSAEAVVALRAQEYIWTAIAAYYALFHLSIALMFLLPQELEKNRRGRLAQAWSGGSEDPTEKLIPHWYVPMFLEACEAKGLSPRLREFLQAAWQLRVDVNYGPRVAWVGNRPAFKSPAHTPSEVETIANALESVLSSAIRWVSRATDLSWVRAVDAAAALAQFLTEDNLLYVRWCAPEALAEARQLAKRLPNTEQLWRENDASREGA
ncbi:MAG: hypothetical protein HY713_09300 [candidate division NC10 bacterium]|nr:hypothetical protein [candidate division NC10 bacterium]